MAGVVGEGLGAKGFVGLGGVAIGVGFASGEEGGVGLWIGGGGVGSIGGVTIVAIISIVGGVARF